jgi:hypothetical protein
VEALSIASAIKHIVQYKFQTCALTDSKPCVQSFKKLCRGQFSSNPRVTTFLSTVSRYQISLRHLAKILGVTSVRSSWKPKTCCSPHVRLGCTFRLDYTPFHNSICLVTNLARMPRLESCPFPP